MGLAQLVTHDHEPAPSEEARERISSARIRDLTFLVKRISKRHLDQEQAISLAMALADVESRNEGFSRDLVEASLRRVGHNSDEAVALAGHIFE